MSQPKMDHNDLARLLDRRLSEEERGSALAHLAESDDDEVLGDAAYLLRELEEGAANDDGVAPRHPHVDDTETGRDPKVVPLRPPSTPPAYVLQEVEDEGVAGGEGAEAYHPDADETETGRDPRVVPLRRASTTARPRRRVPARWLAMAAMVAGVLLVPLALSRSGSRGPGDFAALLASPQAGLPTDWDKRPWTVTRGEEDVAAENARAARLGVLQVDLEVAVAAGQAENTGLLSAQIAQRLNEVAGSGALAAAYRDIGARAGEPAEALMPSVAEARESLALFVDEDHFDLGAWAEAASIAAQRQDAAFFQARASRKMLDRAASLPSLDAETRAAVQAIQEAAQADQPNWTVLETQSKELLKQIGD